MSINLPAQLISSFSSPINWSERLLSVNLGTSSMLNGQAALSQPSALLTGNSYAEEILKNLLVKRALDSQALSPAPNPATLSSESFLHSLPRRPSLSFAWQLDDPLKRHFVLKEIFSNGFYNNQPQPLQSITMIESLISQISNNFSPSAASTINLSLSQINPFLNPNQHFQANSNQLTNSPLNFFRSKLQKLAKPFLQEYQRKRPQASDSSSTGTISKGLHRLLVFGKMLGSKVEALFRQLLS